MSTLEEYLLIIQQQNEIIAEQSQTIKKLTELLNQEGGFTNTNGCTTQVPTFSEYAQVFLEEKRGQVKPSSFSSYQIAIKNHLLPFFKDVQIDLIDKTKVQQFINESPLCNKSKKTHVILLKNILNHASEKNIIPPVRTFKVTYPDEIEQDVKTTLSEKEFEKLKKACTEMALNVRKGSYNYGLAILIAMYTGMRIGEICGLQWRHINFEESVILVRQNSQQAFIDGKQVNYISSPKSKTSVRDIPINKTLIPILLQCRSERDNYVVTNTKKPVIKRLVGQHCNDLLKSLGIEHLSFHKLRHNFCSLIQEKGATEKTAMLLMGHSSLNMTEHYTHIKDGEKAIAVNRF